MSRTNASGWIALAVVAAVFVAAVLIREAPGVRPAAVRPFLAARALPLLATPHAVKPDAFDATNAALDYAVERRARSEVRRTPRARLLAEARTELPQLRGSLPTAATDAPLRPVAAPVSGVDTVVAAVQESGATDTPLAARRLEILTHTATTPREGESGTSRDADNAGAVKRAFDTAGRSIAGGMKTAGAAIRGVF